MRGREGLEKARTLFSSSSCCLCDSIRATASKKNFVSFSSFLSLSFSLPSTLKKKKKTGGPRATRSPSVALSTRKARNKGKGKSSSSSGSSSGGSAAAAPPPPPPLPPSAVLSSADEDLLLLPQRDGSPSPSSKSGSGSRQKQPQSKKSSAGLMAASEYDDSGSYDGSGAFGRRQQQRQQRRKRSGGGDDDEDEVDSDDDDDDEEEYEDDDDEPRGAGSAAGPFMDAVVKVYCVHTEPNYSLPWQRKRQFASTSSGFVIRGPQGERWLLTNAHSVEYHSQVKVRRRGEGDGEREKT